MPSSEEKNSETAAPLPRPGDAPAHPLRCLDPLACASALGALALIIALNISLRPYFSLPFPPPESIRAGREDAVQTSAFLALGMRRMAADLAFIRLLVYYGSEESTLAHLPPGTPHIEAYTFGTGYYPELKDRALRMIDVDPYFTYGVLYAAGALAFNLDRPDEALDILQEAARYDTHDWTLKTEIAGIGFSKKGDPLAVIRELTPVLLEPDCPVMLKNILAFLNRRNGRVAEAVRIYKDILKSRDPSYRQVAEQALRELGAQ